MLPRTEERVSDSLNTSGLIYIYMIRMFGHNQVVGILNKINRISIFPGIGSIYINLLIKSGGGAPPPNIKNY